MVEKDTSLRDALSAALPDGTVCKAHYVHTPSKPCDSLFSPPPGLDPEKTRSTSHFLTVSVLQERSVANSSPAGSEACDAEVLVVGLEIFVYTAEHLTTIFVGKADSTGYLPSGSTPRSSPIKIICTTFLEWLSTHLRRKHPSRALVISLFARAQAQYLFPGSAEQSTKHILDDRQLIKWWAKVLNPIASQKSTEGTSLGGYLTIPGYDTHEMRMYFPRDASGQTVWKAGNPLEELGVARGISPNVPPRCLLPRFPDDPKARYMTDLDEEVGFLDDTSVTDSPSKKRTRKWKNIGSLDQFWEAMEFRQECASGRVVGFLWVVMPPLSPVAGFDDQAPSASQQTSASDEVQDRETTPTPTVGSSPKKRTRRPLTGPIIPRQPRLKGGSSALSVTNSSELSTMVTSRPSTGVTLSKDAYDKSMHILLHLDFCTFEVAAQSTTKWILEVSRLSGERNWAMEIVGTLKPVELANVKAAVEGKTAVTDIGTMVRKKRKVIDDVEKNSISVSQVADVAPMNVLAGGMLRKKPKKPADL